MKNKIPNFNSEDKEREFWTKNDSVDFIDFSKAQTAIFPRLKPSATKISIRLPDSLLDSIKVLANKRDVPYQSLMKILLSEAVNRELTKSA